MTRGYGLIYLGITVFAHVKLGKKVKHKEPFILLYVLSICTIIWGALTGNWFGVEAISQVSPFKDLIIPSLNAYSSVSQNTVIHICFVIGAVQLTIGHLMAAFRYINSLKAIEQIGWIFIIWAAYFLACMFVLKQPIPSYFTYLLATGVGLVLFTIFADRQKRKHAPIEIWDLVHVKHQRFCGHDVLYTSFRRRPGDVGSGPEFQFDGYDDRF